MIAPNARRALAAGALFAVAACIPRDAGFGSVRNLVRERANVDVHWRYGEGMAEPDERVRQILSRPISSEDAVQVALLNNAELQAAFEEIGVARAVLAGSTLPSNPEVEGHIGFVQDGERPDLGFEATENLTALLFLPLRRGAADSELEAARVRAAGSSLELAFTARTAFYDYQAAEQIRELQTTVFDATAASWELAQRLHEAGNITDLDFANERAFYEEARMAVANAEVAALHRREILNRLMGLSGADTSWRAAGRLPDPTEQLPPIADLERRAIERSLDLRELETRFAAAARRGNVARAESLLPELRAGVRAEREEGPWEIGPVVSLALPLFEQGQTGVGVAEAEMRRIRGLYTARAIRVRSEVRAVRDQLVTLGRTVAHYQDVLLPLREHIVQESLRQYNAMQLGAFQLIAAKQAEVQTGRDYVGVLRNYWRARATLDQLLAGRLASAADADLDIARTGAVPIERGAH